jgi:hypothetical protein
MKAACPMRGCMSTVRTISRRTSVEHTCPHALDSLHYRNCAISRSVPLVGAEFGLSSADWQVRGRLKRCDAASALPLAASPAVWSSRGGERLVQAHLASRVCYDAVGCVRGAAGQDDVDDRGDVLGRKKLGVLTRRYFQDDAPSAWTWSSNNTAFRSPSCTAVTMASRRHASAWERRKTSAAACPAGCSTGRGALCNAPHLLPRRCRSSRGLIRQSAE